MTYEQSETAKAVKMAEALTKLEDGFRADGQKFHADRVADVRMNLPTASLARLYSIIREA